MVWRPEGWSRIVLIIRQNSPARSFRFVLIEAEPLVEPRMATADADHHAPAAQHVGGGEVRKRHRRMMERRDRDRSENLHALGARHLSQEQRERIGHHREGRVGMVEAITLRGREKVVAQMIADHDLLTELAIVGVRRAAGGERSFREESYHRTNSRCEFRCLDAQRAPQRGRPSSLRE
jgi:hypothetical protein